MKDKEVILQKIIQDAQSDAQDIIFNAQEDSRKTLLECNEKAQAFVEESNAKATSEGEKFIERQKTLARLDAKKVILNAKQQLVKRAFDLAKEMLLGMSKQDYLSFVQKQIQKYASSGDKVILCASAPISSTEVCAFGCVSELNLRVEKGPEDFGGGIKIVGEKRDIDLSFGALISAYGETHAQEVSTALFK